MDWLNRLIYPRFVLFAMLTAFCVCAEYSITRPASQSIFLTIFSVETYPIFWLATVPLNLAVVSLYNRLLPRFGPLRMFVTASCIVAFFHILCSVLLPVFPALIFVQFCWKDIYILLMLKQLWSMIHTAIPTENAKRLYGIIFAGGTCGSVFGSIISGCWATSITSERLFLLTLPLYAAAMFGYTMAYRNRGSAYVSKLMETEAPPARETFAWVLRSRPLLTILSLVVFMQLSIALVEYQFGHYLKTEISSTDLRTAYCGRLTMLVQVISLVLQCIGSGFLIEWLGLRRSHLVVPLFLCLVVGGQIFSPGFAMATLAYVGIKSTDYSFFSIIREMLFIPLRLDEKFRAKAVIDVFAYRTSKALASFLIVGLQGMAGAMTCILVPYCSVILFGAWITLASLWLRSQRQEDVQKANS